MDGWFGSLFIACLEVVLVDCFVAITYVTLGCCCLVLNNMLDGSYVIRC